MVKNWKYGKDKVSSGFIVYKVKQIGSIDVKSEDQAKFLVMALNERDEMRKKLDSIMDDGK